MKGAEIGSLADTL